MDTPTNILILDDSVEFLDALKIFLEYKSFHVRTVNSGLSLKSELVRSKPDIIILDVYIRGHADGREICRLIKSDINTRNIPVILMSASKRGLDKFEECSADVIIEKPFNLSDLLLKINSLAGIQHQAKNEKTEHPWSLAYNNQYTLSEDVIIPPAGSTFAGM